MTRIIILLMLSSLSLPAQENLRPLSVGDTVPDVVLPHLMHYSEPSARLAQISPELVILDFWATWCTSCLHSLPVLDTLQKTYANRLQVLLVSAATTGDTPEKIEAFLKRRLNKDGRPYTFPVVVSDSVLSHLFRHRLLPHYAWIRKGKVVAITGPEALTATQVEEALSGAPLSVRTKRDLMEFDPHQPLFVGNNGGHGETIRYRSTLAGMLEGLPSASGLIKDSAAATVRLFFTNTSILQLYRFAHKVHLPMSRTLLQVSDPAAVAPAGEEGIAPEHTYSYELILPLRDADRLHPFMQQDLERCLGYRARLDTRTVPCLVLREEEGVSGPPKKARRVRGGEGTQYKWHSSLPALATFLSHKLPLPVVCEALRDFPVTLPRDVYEDRGALERALHDYGLQLCPGERPLELFVLQEAEKAPGTKSPSPYPNPR